MLAGDSSLIVTKEMLIFDKDKYIENLKKLPVVKEAVAMPLKKAINDDDVSQAMPLLETQAANVADAEATESEVEEDVDDNKAKTVAKTVDAMLQLQAEVMSFVDDEDLQGLTAEEVIVSTSDANDACLPAKLPAKKPSAN